MNGPATANTAAASNIDKDDPGAKFARPPKKVCSPTLASGTWNRAIRCLRILTNTTIAMTFIGLFYLKQHPQIDESMECYGLGTQEKCEDTYINFLDNIQYCTWYADTDAPNWGEDASHCYYNYDKLSNMQVMILAVLLTAILMGFLQWPLDVVFNALLISPKKTEYFVSEEDIYKVSFLSGDYNRRMDLLQDWRRTDNLSGMRQT